MENGYNSWPEADNATQRRDNEPIRSRIRTSERASTYFGASQNPSSVALGGKRKICEGDQVNTYQNTEAVVIKGCWPSANVGVSAWRISAMVRPSMSHSVLLAHGMWMQFVAPFH